MSSASHADASAKRGRSEERSDQDSIAATALASFRIAETKGQKVLANIQELRELQQQKRLERKQVTKELRNKVKQRQRLRKRASSLSQEDLFEVLAMREMGKKKHDKKESLSPPPEDTQPGSPSKDEEI